MKLKIEFFSTDMMDALKPGIYQVAIKINNEKKSLYIGESVYPIVRCAEHLFNLENKPKYFGFTEKTINNPDISLVFQIIKNENDNIKRKQLEKALITTRKPISQSGISDRLDIERVAILDKWVNANK